MVTTHQLDFAVRYVYDSREIGITIEVTLQRGNKVVVCDTKIDTGSEYCLFGREFADELGIEIETGYQKRFSTLTNSFVAFGHDIEIETLGLKFDALIYFAEDYAIKRNLLGRQGWLQSIKFGLDDYRSEIYISPNQENY